MRDAPKYWPCETSGLLKPAVEAYLHGKPLSDDHVRVLRAYLKQWVDSPVWDQNPYANEDEKQWLAELRRKVDEIHSRNEVRECLSIMTNRGMDPL
jgi:hypothetical protein